MSRILVVEDEIEARRLLEARLSRRGHSVLACGSGEEALELLLSEEPLDVVVTDLRMPGMDGIQLCERIVGSRPDLPVVVLTAFGSLETAISAIRAGAYDFVTKPVELAVLEIAIDRAVAHRQTREELRRLRLQAPGSPEALTGLIGASHPMRRIMELVDQIAGVETTVLLTGESGTGKEVVARGIHRSSRRKDGPFIPVNCSAIPEALLESELFGHAKGAFTDAHSARVGLLGRAERGTLFLDEVGELPLAVQPKLLRALQDRRIRAVGSDEERPIDVRIVAATNSDLRDAIAEKRFREDLFYRLNVICIELPPLRSRGEDVLLLATHFVNRFAKEVGKDVRGITAEAAERLRAYHWPGNVRELQNCVERAVALTRNEQLVVDDLPDTLRALRRGGAPGSPSSLAELVPLEVVELRHVRQVYEATGGNKRLAAQILGLDRKTLYRKLELCGLAPKQS